MSTQDRVSYSHGFTVPGPGAYTSNRIDISISTDLRPGETPEQALARARAFVLARCDEEMGQVAPAAKPRVEDEAFDPNNTAHIKLAFMVFDAERITSEKARKYKLEQVLKGKRVGDIGQIIRDDEKAFRAGRAEPFQVTRRDGTKSEFNGQWPRR